jgi:hypothetical protein
MVHVFQAFPFGKSAEAIENIGWWTKVCIPLITQWKARTEAEEDLKIAPAEEII